MLLVCVNIVSHLGVMAKAMIFCKHLHGRFVAWSSQEFECFDFARSI